MTNIENNPGFDTMDTGKVSESKKISEQASGRAKDDSKKAKQAAQQIKQQTHENQLIAYMFKLLFTNISSESLIRKIYIILIEKQIDIHGVFAIFVPNVKDHIDNDEIKQFFEEELSTGKTLSISEYVIYLKKVFEKYKSLENIEQEFWIEFICDIIYSYEIIDKDILNKLNTSEKEKYHKELINILSKEIFNS